MGQMDQAAAQMIGWRALSASPQGVVDRVGWRRPGAASPKSSFLKCVREQFPALEKVAAPSSGGVAFRIVMAMKQHFAGETCAALLAAMTANMRPKIVIVVDPDIDVPSNAIGPVQVDWACAFRMQPARDMIVVDALPGGTLDSSVDRQTGSVVRIDATFPFGAEIRNAGARPVSRDICGPALAEKGHQYIVRRCAGSMSFRS